MEDRRGGPGPKCFALVPGDEGEHLLIIEPIEIEVIDPVVAEKPVVVANENLDSNMPDKLLQVEIRANRGSKRAVARLVHGLDQLDDEFWFCVGLVRFRFERQRHVQVGI